MKWLLANLRRRAVFAIHFRRCIVEQLILSAVSCVKISHEVADCSHFFAERVVSGEAIFLPLAPQPKTYTDSHKKSR
jgi:hypothetical protein